MKADRGSTLNGVRRTCIALVVALAGLTAATAGQAAGVSTCPGATTVGGTATQQLAAMRCVIGHVRAGHGLAALRPSPRLDRSAGLRAGAIERCDQFSHTACGDPFGHVFAQVGYAKGTYSVAENLAWATPTVASPNATVAAWLRSPEHRANLLARGWRDLGVAFVRAPSLFGAADVTVWVTQFGRRSR